jgi:hypothetical protein
MPPRANWKGYLRLSLLPPVILRTRLIERLLAAPGRRTYLLNCNGIVSRNESH